MKAKNQRPDQESNLEAPKGAAFQAAARPLCDTGLKILENPLIYNP